MINISITEERYKELLEFERECLKKRKTQSIKTDTGPTFKDLVVISIKEALKRDPMPDNKFDVSAARSIFKAMREGKDNAKNMAFSRAIADLKAEGIIIESPPSKLLIFKEKA